MHRALIMAVFLLGCSQPTTDTNKTSQATGAATATATSTSSASTGFHCFTWTRDQKPSTDCFRDRTACETAQSRMSQVGRETKPCEARAVAHCTVAARASAPESKHERCFAESAACEGYRKQSEGRGFTAGPCETR